MNCEGCTFCVTDDENMQIGCEAGRIEKYVDQDAATPGPFYELKRFCNLYRDADYKGSVQTALDAVQLTFGIVIYDEQFSSELDSIKIGIDSIANLNYDQKNIQLIISSFASKPVAKLVELVSYAQEKGVTCLLSIDLTGSVAKRDHDNFSKCQQSNYLVKMSNTAELSPDLFKTINEEVNVDLENIAVYQGNGVAIMPKYIVSNVYTLYNDFDIMVETVGATAKDKNMFKAI